MKSIINRKKNNCSYFSTFIPYILHNTYLSKGALSNVFGAKMTAKMSETFVISELVAVVK